LKKSASIVYGASFAAWGGPLHGNPNALKPLVLDELEVLGLQFQAPFTFLRGFQGVAKVHAAPKGFVHGEDVEFLGLWLLSGNRGDHQSDDQQREDEAHNKLWIDGKRRTNTRGLSDKLLSIVRPDGVFKTPALREDIELGNETAAVNLRLAGGQNERHGTWINGGRGTHGC
jgi:hypothetical protein